MYFNPSTHTRPVVDVTDSHKVRCSMRSMHHRSTLYKMWIKRSEDGTLGSAGVPVKLGMKMIV